MKVSVVIPANNEEKYIGKCLASVESQSVKPYEVIVVCDDCTDKTSEVANDAKVINIRHGSAASSRNVGAEAAKGDVLLFIDADSVMKKNLISKVVKAVKKGYVGGTARTRPLESNFVNELWWYWNHMFKWLLFYPSGNSFAVRKFFPGYKRNMVIGEDVEMIKRLGRKGKLKYITDSYIRTSMRRWEKDGYWKTLYIQLTGYILGKKHRYRPVR
jgi:glycosyltransferase involved in cell wall biosynthesis